MAMNMNGNNQQPVPPMVVTPEMKLAVIQIIAFGVLNRKDDYGNFTGGFKKMLNIYEIYEVAQSFEDFQSLTVERATVILDQLIRMPGESPVKFLRRNIKGSDYIWYGLSKKGWLFLHEQGAFKVPEDALEWANEPIQEPTPEQMALNASQQSNRLNSILLKQQAYNEQQRAKLNQSTSEHEPKGNTPDTQEQSDEEVSATTSGEMILGKDHPANTGELPGIDKQTPAGKKGPFGGLFGKN